jgi:hypothetical protein
MYLDIGYLFKEYIQFLNRLYHITWFRTVYTQSSATCKSVSCSKPGCTSITCSKIEHISL